MLSELNARQGMLYERAIERGIDDEVFTPIRIGTRSLLSLCAMR
jgi:hypothetical protein